MHSRVKCIRDVLATSNQSLSHLTLLCTSGWTRLPLPSSPALGKASASTSSQDSAAKRPRLDQPQQPQAFMQAGMAAYPAAVGGAPGGVPGFVPGMMPPYQMQRPPPMTQAAPRGPLFPSAAAAPVGSNSQLRQVRGDTLWGCCKRL